MLDRRKVLGGGVALGGAAWVAPALLSTPAHAQGSEPTPTTDVPPTTVPEGFAPVALAGSTTGAEPANLVVDAGGRVRLSTDLGGTWSDPLGGGTIGISPIGLMARQPGVLDWFAVSADGTVRRSGPDAASWVDDTPLDIAPVAVTPDSFGTRMLAVDVNGAVRSTASSATPLAWTPGGTMDISPVAINGLYQAFAAVDADGRIRVSPDGGATWVDPMAGGTIGISPVAVIGLGFIPVYRVVRVVDADGNQRGSGSAGATWSDPGPIPGLSPVVAMQGGLDPILAVDAGGNVRAYDAGTGTWTTPAGTPIT
jgi:hypothetical protein